VHSADALQWFRWNDSGKARKAVWFRCPHCQHVNLRTESSEGFDDANGTWVIAQATCECCAREVRVRIKWRHGPIRRYDYRQDGKDERHEPMRPAGGKGVRIG